MNDNSDEKPIFVAPGGAAQKVADPWALPRIEGKYVHKVNQRNVILARVDRVPGAEDEFEAELTPDWDHPFFFEHPLDHVPSMMLVESGRQLGIALAHMYFGVPFGVVFITDFYEIRFTAFAEVECPEPVIIRATVRDKKYRRGELHSLQMQGRFRQGDAELGQMKGGFTFYPRKTFIRLRRRGQRRFK